MTLLSPNPFCFLPFSYHALTLPHPTAILFPPLFLTLLSSPRLVRFPSSLLMPPVLLPSLEGDGSLLLHAPANTHGGVNLGELLEDTA